jgi:hypothetical protein
MTSKIKVDNINKVSDDSNIIKKCGTTTTIGSGASNPIVVDGSAVTLGRCGGTVALASGATQSGFGRTGTVDWNTTPKTATFTAVSGEGYFVNTSGGAVTANLPAGSAGAIVAFADYTRTFGSNALTINPNGSEKVGGVAQDATLDVGGQSATFVYVDGTEGWINVQETQTSQTGRTGFVMASGGTETTVGNDKIHTFTGPGTFCVSALANTPACNEISYLVVGGGGGSGAYFAGGGAGGGGFREDKSPITPYTASPLDGAGSITVTATAFPIVVGAGGAGGPVSSYPSEGVNGSNSSFSTIISAGGGGGGGLTAPGPPGDNSGNNGASGGGGAGYCLANPGPGGSGNTPPVSPPQGNNGGTASTSGPDYGSAGGGGATAVGVNGQGSGSGSGNGGAGATTSINNSSTTYAGGGGGGATPSGPVGAGGPGGGGQGAPSYPGSGTAGTANTGGGAGGSSQANGATGGSGVVIIRYKFQ